MFGTYDGPGSRAVWLGGFTGYLIKNEVAKHIRDMTNITILGRQISRIEENPERSDPEYHSVMDLEENMFAYFMEEHGSTGIDSRI